MFEIEELIKNLDEQVESENKNKGDELQQREEELEKKKKLLLKLEFDQFRHGIEHLEFGQSNLPPNEIDLSDSNQEQLNIDEHV